VASLREVFEQLNRLKEEGTLLDYAVGGASAVPFHAEPVTTYDLNVFVFLPSTSGVIISMAPLYTRLGELRLYPSAEHVLIAGVPVQFLPAYNPLVEEAVQHAVTFDYDGEPVRVVSAEHLAALALQTGGGHRIARIGLLERSPGFDAEKLTEVLRRHGLETKWQKYLALSALQDDLPGS
jgi:hypothetical protein